MSDSCGVGDAPVTGCGRAREILQTSIAAAISLVAGSLGAVAVLHADIAGDPVDVVGLPIVSGYSERSEQLAYLLFWLTPIAVALLTVEATCRLRPRHLRRIGLGCLFALPLVTVIRDIYSWEWLWLLLAVVISVRGGAKYSGDQSDRPPVQLEFHSWVVLLMVLLFERFGWVLGVLSVPRVQGVALLSVGFALICLWRAGRAGMLLRVLRGDVSEKSPVLVIVAVMVFLPVSLWLVALAAVAACLLSYQAIRSQRAVNLQRAVNQANDGVWLSCAAILSVYLSWLNWSVSFPPEPIRVIALVLVAVAVHVTTMRRGEAWAATGRQLAVHCSPGRTRAFVIGVAALPFLVSLPWTGLVVGGIVWLIGGRKWRAPRFGSAVAVAGLLLVAFLPRLPPLRAIDPFHDGQVLSAVWEVESGRTLFSDVFPLRGYAFFVTWLGRVFLPRTFESSCAFMSLMTYVPVAGGLLVGFVWTRSVRWGLAVALVIATQPMIPRQGFLLILAAFAAEILRSKRRSRWLMLAIPGAGAALFGFDGIGPLTLAACGSVVLAAVLARGPVTLAVLKQCLLDALIITSSLVIPFSVLVAVTCGWSAATTYWSTFLDYSSSVNAFFGVPLSFVDLLDTPGTASLLILMVLWNVVAIVTQLSHTSTFWFVSLFTFFSTLRAAGRSDPGHFDCTVYWSCILAVLLLFEVLRHLRRSGYRGRLSDRLVAASLLIAIAPWFVSHRPGNPVSLYRQLAALSQDESLDYGRTKFVIDTIDEGEWFWPVENAMSTYAHRRHNPTRHALAYAAATAKEQRRVVNDLRQRPPRLIEWPSRGIDGIATPLRYYIISPFIYRNYVPAEVPGYLQPRGAGAHGVKHISSDPAEPLLMGQLPHAWGARRWPQLQSSVKASAAVPARLGEPSSADDEAAFFALAVPPSHGNYNYLLVQVSCQLPVGDGEAAQWCPISIRFAENGDERSRGDAIRFNARSDGRQHDYLIPVGCSSVWHWRPGIDEILVSSEWGQVTVSECRLLAVDDFR